jgi:VWFA-related protein
MRAVAVIAGLSLTAAIAQEIPVIRVPVRLVTLPTLVFSKENRLVAGLQAADFRVLDGGRAQKVAVEESSAPVSIALVIQANQDVREYIPFLAKSGSVVDDLLVGESGEVAVVTYSSEVRVAKPFESGTVATAFRNISANGKPARAIDAGMRAISLLKERPASRSRVLLFVGQPMDNGSESKLDALKEAAERENVAVFSLTLPEFGKAFVSDTFSLQGAPGGGFTAGADLGKLISALNRSGKAKEGTDPFSVLTAATGGTQFHFRKQRELEDAIAAIGVQLRSAYLVSYYPDSPGVGYHSVRIEVNVEGVKVYARPGYWLAE